MAKKTQTDKVRERMARLAKTGQQKGEVSTDDITPKAEGSLYDQLKIEKKPKAYTDKSTVKIDTALLNELKQIAQDMGYGKQYHKILKAILRQGIDQLRADM